MHTFYVAHGLCIAHYTRMAQVQSRLRDRFYIILAPKISNVVRCGIFQQQLGFLFTFVSKKL